MMWYLLAVWFGFVGMNEAELKSRIGFLAIALLFTIIGLNDGGKSGGEKGRTAGV